MNNLNSITAVEQAIKDAETLVESIRRADNATCNRNELKAHLNGKIKEMWREAKDIHFRLLEVLDALQKDTATRVIQHDNRRNQDVRGSM